MICSFVLMFVEQKTINYTRISKLVLKAFCIHIEETLINNFVTYCMWLRAVFTALV